MLISNLTTEHFRCLAMYITYSLHKQKHIVPQGLSTTRDTLRNKELETRRMTISKSPRSPLRSPRNRVFDVPQRAVVVKILELFTDLLCEPRNLLSIKKFAKTVTNKVRVQWTFMIIN